jgi:hypothetical protein
MGPPRAPGSLEPLLAAQLGTCIAALKAGKQDQVLCMSSFVSSLFVLYVHLVLSSSLQLSPVAMMFGIPCLRW